MRIILLDLTRELYVHAKNLFHGASFPLDKYIAGCFHFSIVNQGKNISEAPKELENQPCRKFESCMIGKTAGTSTPSC